MNQTDPAESSGRLRVHPRSLAFPFELRTRASDVRSLLSTVIRSEYEVFLRGASPEYIVDAGAFTGDFSALALSRFPQSKLVAVEPQEEAARIARLNLAPYGERAIVVQAAVWNADGKVNLEGDGTGANVGLGGGGLQIESMTMTTILERHGFPRIDLLKCDIEGAEAQVFSARDQSWLSSVSLLLIELHTPEAAASVRGACVNAGLHRHEQYRSTHAFRRTQQGDVGDLLSDI